MYFDYTEVSDGTTTIKKDGLKNVENKIWSPACFASFLCCFSHSEVESGGIKYQSNQTTYDVVGFLCVSFIC